MKEKPQIKVYQYTNNSFRMIAIIDDYMEVSTEDNLYECGSFTCSINLNLPNASIFKRGLFLDIDNNLYEITSITDSIGSDGKGSQIRQITGYDARNILKRRIVRSMNANGNFELTAKGEICLRRVIEAQCGLSAEEKRRLPITNIIPSIENAQGSVYALSVSYSNLYEVCKTIATQSGIGWKFIFDGESLNLVVYTGQDRSGTVRFSPDMDSLADGSYTDSSDSYASCVYVGGKGQNGEQDIYEGEIDGATGLDRFEVFDNKTELTTEAEYKAEAESMLLQYNKNISISGNGLAHCPYEYGKQYNVGDYITVAFSGHSAKVQILSVTQSWQYGQYSIQFEYGKPLATLDGQLQAIMRKVQEGNKPRTTDSVMWYTLPQDTAQSKDEIKYDTIGFMGSTATQSTFTLYLDEEKNGAKTYHVYLKELTGNNLTLTTGRTGAKDLTISTGTYVLIIYVDENGNVNEQGTTATDVVVQGNTQPVTSDAVATAIQQATNQQWELDTTVKIYDTKYCENERPSTCYKRDEGELIHYLIDSVGTVAISSSSGKFFHFDPAIINLSNMISGIVSGGRRTDDGRPSVYWSISTNQNLDCWNGARIWNDGSTTIASNYHVYFDFFMPKTV